MPGLSLGWQKFVGRTYRFAEPHGRIRPMIMDATVEQVDGYRFAYLLPFDDHDALIEDTYYSDDPYLEAGQLGADLDAMASAIGEAATVDQEVGVLPVVLDGEVANLWNDTVAPLIGIRGGFFHPTTGYSLPDAARNAVLLAEQNDFSSTHIHALLRQEAERLWQERSFFRLLNRMLFKAAEPAQRYRVLEHFYRLPDATIGRFYAAQLTLFDKARILSGRPPVPISRALHAVRGAAA
jgi:lycopene beta-cyclase